MSYEAVEIELSVERDKHGRPVVDLLRDQEFCRIAWQRGAGPPARRGIYFWLDEDCRVFYVGKAASNHTSHLYRRITAYKRATPGKTQWTSLRVNTDILGYVRSGSNIRLVCLPMPETEPGGVSRIEESLIAEARPPWNRQGNPNPRTMEEALPLAALLKEIGIEFRQ